LAQARIVYFHWTPTLITVRTSLGGQPLREPPHVVINTAGKIAALGQEAEAASRQTGLQLTQFPDVAAARQQQGLASIFLSYYWLTVELRDRSNWWVFLSGLWPSLRSYLILHPAEGAERGMGEAEAKWLRGAFKHATPKRTFVWSGAQLDPAARLRDAPGRGQWVGHKPPPVV
jgi:hypothetical protein